MKQRVSTLIYLSIPFLIMSLIIVAYTHYLTDQQKLERISNSLYSNDSVYLNITPGKKEPFNWNQFDLDKKYTIFKEASDGDTHVRGFFSKGRTDVIPPIIEGRFFQPEDFYKNKKVAVVGKAIKETEYFQYEGERFRIIGRMGRETPTAIDQQVLINIDAFEEITRENTNYYVVDDYSDQKNIINQLKKTDNDVHITVKNKEDKGLNRITGIAEQSLLILYVLLCVIGLTSIFISVYWIHRKTMLITIKQLIGFQQGKIFLSLLLHYLLVTQSFYALGLLTGKLILPFSNDQWKVIGLSYTVTTVLGVVSFVIAFQRKSYKNIIKRLR